MHQESKSLHNTSCLLWDSSYSHSLARYRDWSNY